MLVTKQPYQFKVFFHGEGDIIGKILFWNERGVESGQCRIHDLKPIEELWDGRKLDGEEVVGFVGL